MYKYLVAFVLLAPLIGIYVVEGGEYAGSIGVDGYPNGATLAFSCYVLGIVLVAYMSAGRKRRFASVALSVEQNVIAGFEFRNFAANLLVFNLAFLIVFLLGFGAINVWLGSIQKGEFRANLGQFGAFPNLMTKFITPALLAYAATLYRHTSRKGTTRLWWWANVLVASAIGASWGFKASAMTILLPALLVLNWRVRLRTLFMLALAFIGGLIVFFNIFDAGVLTDSGVGVFLLSRITVLQGDVSWHIWGLYTGGEAFPNYWPTLLAAFGDTTLGLVAGLSHADPYQWMLYHYDFMLNYLAGQPLDWSESGNSLTGTPFSEGLVAGGLPGLILFTVIAGYLVGITYRVLDNALHTSRDVRAAMLSTYFCFNIFTWLNGGAIVQLFHISILVSIGATYAVVGAVRRFRVLQVPAAIRRMRVPHGQLVSE
jgi:hypothetical protein